MTMPSSSLSLQMNWQKELNKNLVYKTIFIALSIDEEKLTLRSSF
jgi:hypothetical protein